MESSTDNTEAAIKKEIMDKPEYQTAIQNQAVTNPEFYVACLPKSVKRRLKALKKLQVGVIELESKFFDEVHKLECQYQKMYQMNFKKRADIVNGLVEPSNDECIWPDDENDPLSENFKRMLIDEGTGEGAVPDVLKSEYDETVKGVPNFWLTVFKNVELLRSMVQPHDEPILKHLLDIRVIMESDQHSFRLDFVFSPNDYFSNEILSKTYLMRFEVNQEEPLSYEGPEVYKCTGTQIDWCLNKNVTVRVVKKLQKHKGRGTKRVLTKTVQNDSFFNFFSPPNPECEETDEETDQLLDADFEIGQFLRERIVPRAILYYTGEANDDEEDEEEYGDYDDEDEGQEGEDDEEEHQE